MRCTALRVRCRYAKFVSDDQRRRAFGRPLDFVFYRGLSVHDASVLVTRASDHNPLLVEFSPGKPD
jgi:endonuclease/exonuclease/phosphatase (EEP) superfamily protein YafD